MRLGNGEAFPLSVLDDHTRFALGLFACSNQQQATVQAYLTSLFRRSGALWALPRRILTDNGPPWGSSRTYGITAFEAWLIRLGIRVSHGQIYHPQTQGKVEPGTRWRVVWLPRRGDRSAQPVANGPGRGGRARVDAELVHDAGDVVGRRMGTDEQLASDLLVRAPIDQ